MSKDAAGRTSGKPLPTAATGTRPAGRQILVLGMHRSGTSALTGALARMGIFTGGEDELTEANWENPKGFFERRDVRRICDSLLHQSGADWWKVSRFDLAHADTRTLQAERKSIAALVRQLDQQGSWALKEPRLCVLAPAFLEHMPRALAVIVVRHPAEIALSLRHRNGFPMQAGLALWEAYMAQALAHSQTLERIFLSYHALMAAPEATLSRLGAALEARGTGPLDIAAGIAAIDPSLHHNSEGGGQEDWRLEPSQAALWQALEKAADGGPAPPAPDLGAHTHTLLREFEADWNGYITLETRLKASEAETARRASERDRQTEARLKAEEALRQERLKAEDALRQERQKARAEQDKARADQAVQRAARQKVESELRRTLQRLADSQSALLTASGDRHSAELRLHKMESVLQQTARERARLAAELARTRALADGVMASKGWRLLQRLRRLTRNPFGGVLRRRAVARRAPLTLASPVFDAPWYGACYSDVALSALPPLHHYVLQGAAEGRDPHILFSARHYLDQAAGAGLGDAATANPLEHYLGAGAKAGLDPHPLFSTQWYLEQNPDIARSGINPLEHFLVSGGKEGRAPSPHFDARWYLDQYQDVAEAGLNPLIHYLQTGAEEGRDPGPDFSTRGYLAASPDVAARLENPLVHYVQTGRQEGRNPRGNPVPAASARLPAALQPPGLPRRSALPLNVLVIAWDVGHNPVGRAYMLAEVLDRVVEHVTLAGFQFERYGASVWEPLEQSRLPIITIPGKTMPDFIAAAETLARRVRPDIVIACKPRLPSLQLGLQISETAGCPLIVDIDDHELSFFADGTPLTLEEVEALERGSWADATEPYEARWTRLCETLAGKADSLLVSNSALQARHGGTLLPHVRDETVFDPANRPNRRDMRQRLGIPENAKAVLFFGTPRLHKGLGALARAVGEMDDPDVCLVVVGTAPDRSVTAELERLSRGRCVQLPNQPFSALPSVLAVGDAVALPQDLDHPVSHYQLPAKAIDAIAAGLPLLVTPTPPLQDLIDARLAIPFQPDGLKTALEQCLANRPAAAEQDAARQTFLDQYSYGAAADALRPLLARLAHSRRKPRAAGLASRLARTERHVLGVRAPARRRVKGAGRDVVMFWKQNDTTLYGRRHEMTARYLASRKDVRRVLVLDAPVSRNQLVGWRDQGHPGDQDRLLYIRTMEKLMGLHDTGKLAIRPLIYVPRNAAAENGALADAITADVRTLLDDEGIDIASAVFWAYPRNSFIEPILDSLAPRTIVADIVDDHRAWPNISEEERLWLDGHYRGVLTRAHFAMANRDTVQQSMTEFRKDIRLIANGCDALNDTGTAASHPAFEEMVNWRGPVIGFAGNLEAKIDDSLIERLAEAMPEALIVLIGSTHANPEIRRLSEISNIRMPGVIPYDRIGAWIRRFDVAIIPHRNMALTEAMNPLKQYVYLAHDIPVVASHVGGLEATPGITITHSAEAFITAVKTSAGRRLDPQAARQFVQQNSWEKRLKDMVDEILRHEGN